MFKISALNVPTRKIGIFEPTRRTLLQTINGISDDLSKIIEFNKIKRPNSKFIVVDKAKSKASIYEGERIIGEYDIGVGKDVGDTLNSVTYDYKTKTFSESGRTTPSGEFETAILPMNCENRADFTTKDEVNVILLKGVMHPADYHQNTSLALHQLPNQVYNERLQLLNNQTGRKSMSTGCINFRTEDFKTLAQNLPEGTPVYILPEEAENSLVLTELPNGKLWFKTAYNDKERADILCSAIKSYFGIK